MASGENGSTTGWPGADGSVSDWLVAIWEAPATSWVLAALAVVAGYYLGRLLVRVFGRQIARRFQRPSVTRSVIRAIRTGAFLLGVFGAMTILGFQLGNIVLSVTVFSAVLGLVLAPIVGSVINGLFILADQPYEIGDLIEITDTGRMGFVEDITLRYTKVFTLDNTFLVITNASMRERDVVNYSAEDERTRLSLSLLVTYEGDLDEARRIMERAAADVETVITGGPDIRIGAARYPAAPTCYVDEYADHGVLLTLRYWVRNPYKLLTVRSTVQSNVWDRLGEADAVSIAYPHSHLVFDDTSGTAHVDLTDGDPLAPGDGPPAGRQTGGRHRGDPRNHRSSTAGTDDAPTESGDAPTESGDAPTESSDASAEGRTRDDPSDD